MQTHAGTDHHLFRQTRNTRSICYTQLCNYLFFRRISSANTCWHRPPPVPADKEHKKHMLHAAVQLLVLPFQGCLTAAPQTEQLSVHIPHAHAVMPSILTVHKIWHQLCTPSHHAHTPQKRNHGHAQETSVLTALYHGTLLFQFAEGALGSPAS